MERHLNCRFILLFFALLFSIVASASPTNTTYQARIIKPDGLPLEAANVNFKFTVLDESATCILFAETFSAISMSNSAGNISFALGSGVKSFPASATSFAQVFNNSTPALSCDVGGPGIYVPQSNHDRKVVMQFNDGNGWQTLPAMAINAVPYSIYSGDSLRLGGVSATNYVRYSTIPTCTASQAIRYDGSSFSCVTLASGGGASATITYSDVTTALGYTPADPTTLSSSFTTVASYSTVTATVSNLGTSVTTIAASVSNKITSSTASIEEVLGFVPVSPVSVTTLTSNLSAVSSTLATKITSSAVSIEQVLGYTPAASGSFSLSFSSIISALGYTPTDAVSFTTLSSAVNSVSASVSNLAAAVSAGNFRAADGTALNPGYSFMTASGTGFSQSSNQIQVSTGGVARMQFNAIGISGFSVGNPLINTDGSFATTPPYSFVGDSQMGMYRATAGVLGFTVTGSERMRITSSAVGINTSTPRTALDVSGGLRIGAEPATCSVTLAGTLRYESGNIEYCNGISWSPFGVAGAGITNFNGSTSGSQTLANSLNGTTPAFVTVNGIHTLNIPFASAAATTAGLISYSDYLNFSNKVTSSAAAIAQALGYTPAASGSFVLSSSAINSALGFTAADAASVTTATANISSVSSAVATKITSSAAAIAQTLGYVPAASGSMVSSQWTTNGANINYSSTGNVGIGLGLSSPSYKLALSGTTLADRTIAINNVPVVYLPDQVSFTTSIAVGNGLRSLSYVSALDGAYNTATGINAMMVNSRGSFNTATGGFALAQNTTGGQNSAFGSSALFTNTTGMYNSALGYTALYVNTTGQGNVAMGHSSLNQNTTASNNSAYGYFSAFNTTIAGNNTAVGAYTLFNNKTKTESTAVGFSSMMYADDVSAATAVSYNTAIGAYSLQGSTTAASNTGARNTAIGHSSLRGMTTGSNNIGLGYSAGSAITTGSNNVVIGSNTGANIATSSNNILIADGAGNERIRVDISGFVGLGTSAPTARLQLSSGTTTYAPLKFTSGSVLTSPQAGAMEYDGSNFYLTDGVGTRRTIAATSANGTYDNVAAINNTGNITLLPIGSVVVSSTTASTNSQTGALVVNGGLGVAGNINSSGTIITTANMRAASITATGDVYVGNRLGIGTTTPNYFLDLVKPTGTTQAHISGTGGDDGLFMLALANGGWLSANTAFDGTNWIAKSTSTQILGMGGPNSNMGFYSDFGLTAGASFSPTPRLVVNASGSVGINVNTPIYNLDVQARNGSNSLGTFSLRSDRTTNSNHGGIYFNSKSNFLKASILGAGTDDASGGTLRFTTQNAFSSDITRMTIDASGSVGIGISTLTASATLDVSGTLNISSHIFQGTQVAKPLVSWSVPNASSGAIILKLPGTISNYGMLNIEIETYEYNSNGATKYYIGGHNWNGAWYYFSNRTIGVSEKKVRLAYKDGQYAIVIGDNASNWYYGSVKLVRISNADFYSSTIDLKGPYTIYQDSAAEAYTWISGDLNSLNVGNANFTGNVGIGTTAPSSKLHVFQYTNTTQAVATLEASGTNGRPYLKFRAENADYGYVGYGSTGQPNMVLMNYASGSLLIGTSSTTRLTMNSVGNVGIGTASPVTLLDVEGNATVNYLSVDAGDGVIEGGEIRLMGTASYGNIQLDNHAGNIRFHTFANGKGLQLLNGSIFAESTTLANQFNAAVGIGAAPTAGFMLDVNGNVRATGTTTSWSDVRTKKNIEVIPDSLNKILQIRGVTFDWRTDKFPEKKFKDTRDMGVIAQEVEKVFPEVVTTAQDSYKSVGYSQLVAPLIEAVKELYYKITGVERTVASIQESKADRTEVETLKAENAELKSRLDRLEKLMVESQKSK